MEKYIGLSLPQLKAEKSNLLQEVKYVQSLISAMEGDVKEMPWTTLAINCIASFGELVKTNEILTCIFIETPHLISNPYKKRNYLIALSVALNNLVAKGELVKYSQSGIKGYHYGLSKWFKGGKWEEYISKLQGRIKEEANERIELERIEEDTAILAYPQHLEGVPRT